MPQSTAIPLKPSMGPLFEVDKSAVIRLSQPSGIVFRITPVKRSESRVSPTRIQKTCTRSQLILMDMPSDWWTQLMLDKELDGIPVLQCKAKEFSLIFPTVTPHLAKDLNYGLIVKEKKQLFQNQPC